jgi:polysaccharide export outer membrane protein
MKKNCPQSLAAIFFGCFMISTFFSCTSAKRLTYFQDAQPGQTLQGLPKQPPLYKIRANDNLYVGISTQDPDMNKLIDPSNANLSSAIYEGGASKAVYGNMVLADGTIKLPLIGKVPVEGMTTSEAEEQIKVKARDYLKDVSVKVRVLTYKITIVGEVKVPGVYYNYNTYITIFDAIGLAQGTTDFAKLENVMVVRHNPSGSQTFFLSLTSKSALSSAAYYLQPDDVVVVQPGKNKGTPQALSVAGVIVGSLSAFLLLLNFLK